MRSLASRANIGGRHRIDPKKTVVGSAPKGPVSLLGGHGIIVTVAFPGSPFEPLMAAQPAPQEKVQLMSDLVKE